MDCRKYFGCRVSQRGDHAVNFVVFIALAKDVAGWAGIKRVGEDEEGIQRVEKLTRVSAVQRFFERDAANVIPTSILVAFNPGESRFIPSHLNVQQVSASSLAEKVQWGDFEFEFDPSASKKERVALIVDGQHRLAGLASVNEDIPLLVVALMDATLEEQAFQFIVINNKALKVPVDNVKSIIANIDEGTLRERLKRARINYKDAPNALLDFDTRNDSPFKGLLAWPNNSENSRVVKLAAIEHMLRYCRVVLPGFKEIDDDDSVQEILLSIGRAMRNRYPNHWGKSEAEATAKLMNKVCFTALGEFLVDRLESAMLETNLNVFDPPAVEGYAFKVLQSIPEIFWMAPWSVKLHDSSSVRDLIKKDLRMIAHNARIPGRRDILDGVRLLRESSEEE